MDHSRRWDYLALLQSTQFSSFHNTCFVPDPPTAERVMQPDMFTTVFINTARGLVELVAFSPVGAIDIATQSFCGLHTCLVPHFLATENVGLADDLATTRLQATWRIMWLIAIPEIRPTTELPMRKRYWDHHENKHQDGPHRTPPCMLMRRAISRPSTWPSPFMSTIRAGGARRE